MVCRLLIINLVITCITVRNVTSFVPQTSIGFQRKIKNDQTSASINSGASLKRVTTVAIGRRRCYSIYPCNHAISKESFSITFLSSEESELEETSKESAFKTPPQQQQQQQNRPTVNKATLAFNNKLNQLSRSYDRETAPKVQSLLYTTMDNVLNGIESEIQPNVVSFTAAINAWARSTDKHAAQHAESILQKMHELCTTHPEITPNAYAYNAAITAWTRSRERGSAKKAEHLLNQMWNFYEETGDDNVKPDSRAFNSVVNAAARSREPKCADWAASILERMESLYNAGHKDMQPDALTFGAIINAYANSGEEGSSDRAAQLLQHMESLYQLGYEGVKPNTFVYNSCMNAFAKSNKPGSGEKAEQLLSIMEQMYQEHGENGGVKPDVISYSTVINAHANGGDEDAGMRADEMLNKMEWLYLEGDEDVKPNAIAYTAAIKAWISTSKTTTMSQKGGENDSMKVTSKRVEELMMRMCLQYFAGDKSMKPTKITFDLVLEALRGANYTEGIERMENLRIRIDEWIPNNKSRKRVGRKF